MTTTKFDVTDDAKQKVATFEQSDSAYKAAVDAFEAAHATELATIEKLREARNGALDDAVRVLRTEAAEANIAVVKRFTIGPFTLQKRWSDFFVPDKLVPMLKDRKLYEHALNAKIVAEKVEIAKFAEVKGFLKAHNIETDFEICEDGQELTPAVSGPKPVLGFGVEAKDRG